MGALLTTAALLAPTEARAGVDPGQSGAKLDEQHAALALVPDGSQTVTAAADGAWSDPATWDDGVPAAGARVLIPEGVTVTYDANSDEALTTVRIDGTLEFDPGVTTKLVVDTVVVTHPGVLRIGTAAAPISTQHRAEIVFSDVPGEPADPEQLGLGLLAFGAVEIHGDPRTSMRRLVESPTAGQSSLALDEAPFGWREGDRVLVPATAPGGLDDVLDVASVDGDTITLSGALEHDHPGPYPRFTPHLVNLERSVVLRSASPEPATRGYVRLMHRRDVDVRYAAFVDLGRTDRSVDFSGANLSQRYPLYVHGNGPGTSFEDPVMLVGNVVERSPGHGMVVRDGHFMIDANVAFDIFGGGFVVEAGNETGVLRRNIATRIDGREGSEGHPKRAHGTEHYAGGGDGFWFQSRLIHNRDNVAAGVSGKGFVYFHRATALAPDGVLFASLEHPEIAHHRMTGIDKPAIQGFSDNEAYGAGEGLTVIKNSPRQFHDDRSVLDGFSAWNVQNGVSWDYTGHYLMRNFELYASADSKDMYWSSKGVATGQNIVDMTFEKFTIEGFHEGFHVHHNTAAPKLKYNSLPDNLQAVDFTMADNDVDYELNAHDDPHLIVLDAGPEETMPSVSLSADSDLAFGDELEGPGQLALVGTRRDSLGEHPHVFFGAGRDIESEVLRNVHELSRPGLVERGVYTATSGDAVALFDLLVTDRYSGRRVRYELPVRLLEGGDQGPDRGAIETFDVDGVLRVNSSPYAHYDYATTEAGEEVTIDVLENDSDVDGDDIELVEVDAPRHGSVEDLGGGDLRYVPDEGFDGIDAIRYVIRDPAGSGRRSEGTVRIDVLPTTHRSPGGSDDGGSDDGGSPGDDSGDADGGADGGTDGGAPTSGGAGLDTAGGDAEGPQGCGCTADHPGGRGTAWSWLSLFGVVAYRRRARR